MVELPEVGSVWESNTGEDSVTIIRIGFGGVTYRWNGEDGDEQFETKVTYEMFRDRFTLRVPEPVLPEINEVMYRDQRALNTEVRLFAMDSKEYDQVLLITENIDSGKSTSAHLLKLDVDDALDLASDLTRMALQLKRRLN